ncbi:hypothetical protein ACI2IX_18930 [Leifsonia aquatica]|uniref:hypothetical protein n=1 Tax=Leifsonia aquatica TaxID=144185 RepID=UPI00384BD8C8
MSTEIVYRDAARDRQLLDSWLSVSGYWGAMGHVVLFQVRRAYQFARSGGVKAFVSVDGVNEIDAWFPPGTGQFAVPGAWLVAGLSSRWGDHHNRSMVDVADVANFFPAAWMDDVRFAQERDAARAHYESTGHVLPALSRPRTALTDARADRAARTGLTLGIVSLFVNLFGILALIGLILSISSARTRGSSRATWGIVINSVMLGLAVIGALLFLLLILSFA